MSTCIKSNPKPSPFSKWGIDDTVEYVSLYTQRNAKYAESAKETFNEDARQTFFGNGEAATPQIERIVGAFNEEPIIFG